jgi:hypothetical protein
MKAGGEWRQRAGRWVCSAYGVDYRTAPGGGPGVDQGAAGESGVVEVGGEENRLHKPIITLRLEAGVALSPHGAGDIMERMRRVFIQ